MVVQDFPFHKCHGDICWVAKWFEITTGNLLIKQSSCTLYFISMFLLCLVRSHSPPKLLASDLQGQIFRPHSIFSCGNCDFRPMVNISATLCPQDLLIIYLLSSWNIAAILLKQNKENGINGWKAWSSDLECPDLNAIKMAWTRSRKHSQIWTKDKARTGECIQRWWLRSKVTYTGSQL